MGLEVNGVPTKKHFLQNNDLIEIGKYKLKYLNDQVSQTNAADFEKTMVLRAPVRLEAPAEKSSSVRRKSTQYDNGIEKTGRFGVQPPAAPAAQLAAEVETPPQLSRRLRLPRLRRLRRPWCRY